MGNRDEITEFAHMLDLLAMGRNVASKDNLDSEMVRIACTLAATDLSGLSRNREPLHHSLGQRLSGYRVAYMDSSPKRGFSMLAAFSMGFATVIVLVYVSLVIILPLAQQAGREPSVAGEATLNPLLAAVQRLASPTATLSPASSTPQASPTALSDWNPTPLPASTEAPSSTPAWTPSPLPAVTSTPWPTPTWTPILSPAWSPPAQVDHLMTVKGDAGTVQQFSAPLPSENGSRSHTIQIIVNIPPAEENAGRRRVDYAVTCTGAGSENLRWGWWGWAPAGFACGTMMTSDGLLWSHNVVYFVIEVPADSTAPVMYTLTVTIEEYSG